MRKSGFSENSIENLNFHTMMEFGNPDFPACHFIILYQCFIIILCQCFHGKGQLCPEGLRMPACP